MSDFNKLAQSCSNHRMQMISSERILVNPKYDNHTESKDNVKEYVYNYKCFGSCGQIKEQRIANK